MNDTHDFFSLFREDIHSIQGPWDGACYIRFEKFVETGLDILKLINSYDISELLYFKDKNSINQFGGIGSTHVIRAGTPEEALPKIHSLLDIDKRIRLFGGFSFSFDVPVSREWEGFNNCRFTLPLIEIQKRDHGHLITLNYYSEKNVSAGEIISLLTEKVKFIDSKFSGKGHESRFEGTGEKFIPDKTEWIKIIDRALDKIKADKIEKIVLSRKKIITSRNSWDLYSILNKLDRLKEESFLFFYKIDNDLAFLGRSPERLFKIKDGEFIVESIAGTRPRGATPADDKRLEDELMNSPKELEEHRIVSRFIKERMDNFCSEVHVRIDEKILKLHNLQHIITLFSGKVRGEVDFLKIINTFHPTPAVGGHPRDSVYRLIPELEPFHRGWYAGPIGWLRRDEGNFAVAIRSALINGKDLHIFAGAGIVKQSDPLEEWNETDNKMDNYLKGLGDL